MRAHIDESHPDTVLLAEANQWPADVVEYFGDGDECHMAFHFPVMPRMFMALRREEARPIYEILAQTPAIPDNCQWGLFLRNHDELTLEMVADEERDYMYAEYAKDPRMRINVGIRRRLAPLLDNGRDEIELVHAILFSLPGSPVLYYGDEIGMGDNVYLGDRDGVRTPMHWTGDRNAGFSRADFAQLYLPPLMDPVTGYQAVNVEAQLRSPTSLLRWLHRFIALRKEHPVFGLGTYEPLAPDNPRIFAHVRRYEEDVVLCVHNLARSAQAVTLDLSEFDGRRARGTPRRRRLPRRHARPLPAHARPARVLLARSCGGPMLDLTRLPEAELSAFVARQPWFRAHGREGAAARVRRGHATCTPSRRCSRSRSSRSRPSAGSTRSTSCRSALRPEGERERPPSAIATRRRLDGLRRALRPRARGRARRPRPHAAAARDSDVSAIEFLPDRRARLPCPVPASGDAARRSARATRTRSVVDRRGARAQGLPAARGRRQPGGRAAALPDRARLREHARRCSAPTSTPAA